MFTSQLLEFGCQFLEFEKMNDKDLCMNSPNDIKQRT